MPQADKERAQAPYKATFVRLGRAVWFTLESAHRSRGDDALQENLAKVGTQVDQLSGMGLAWIRQGEWSQRRTWTNEEWVAFLRLWKPNGNIVFRPDEDDTPQEEKKLFDHFITFFAFYANLPDRPENAPKELSMQDVESQIDEQLSAFEERLGDPLEPCQTCKKCALGAKLKRCSKCQSAKYCSIDCQRKGWKAHKKVCKSAAP